MRDHRPSLPDVSGADDAAYRARKRRLTDITRQVQEHTQKHPGSVRRSDANKARKAAKQAKASRKANR